MTREEAIKTLKDNYCAMCAYGSQNMDSCDIRSCDNKDAIKALEQEPCEDEYIKVPKKALKYRTAGMVAYNAEWLKNHFDIERTVICGAQEPKTGHWIHTEECDEVWQYRCSKCNMPSKSNAHRYCSNCGSYMYDIIDKYMAERS